MMIRNVDGKGENKWKENRRKKIRHYYREVCISYTPPQTEDNPSAVAKCFAFVEGNALVNVSAVMSLVGQ